MYAPRFFLLDEVGAGDSYVLYDVIHFQRTGVIYRDLSLPPYLPSSYSPLTYILHSLPGRIISAQNAFLGPRAVSAVAFIFCIIMTAWIARALIPGRSSFLVAALLGASISSMYSWALQIRGDFPGILFGLAAIRLLLAGGPWAALAAGVCGGLATQFKFSFVAALGAGCLWLLFGRRWKELTRFILAGLLASVGLYLIYSLSEPNMFRHLSALRGIGFLDIRGDIQNVGSVLNEPLLLLSAFGLFVIPRKLASRWLLVVLFGAISFAEGALADLHPGGNINYFYEGLFAFVPAAALGTINLLGSSRRSIIVGFLVTALFLMFAKERVVKIARAASVGQIGFAAVTAQNQEFERIRAALRGRHIFSTVPRLALLDPEPALVDAFSLWKIDARPIYERVRRAEFDVVITSAIPTVYRKVEYVPSGLRDAIAATYKPYCTIGGTLFEVPRFRLADDAFLEQMKGIGCTPAGFNNH